MRAPVCARDTLAGCRFPVFEIHVEGCGVDVFRDIPVDVRVLVFEVIVCRGTSLIRNTPLLRPYGMTIPKALWRSQRGGDVSYDRGAPVGCAPVPVPSCMRDAPAGFDLHVQGKVIRNCPPP